MSLEESGRGSAASSRRETLTAGPSGFASELNAWLASSSRYSLSARAVAERRASALDAWVKPPQHRHQFVPDPVTRRGRQLVRRILARTNANLNAVTIGLLSPQARSGRATRRTNVKRPLSALLHSA